MIGRIEFRKRVFAVALAAATLAGAGLALAQDYGDGDGGGYGIAARRRPDGPRPGWDRGPPPGMGWDRERGPRLMPPRAIVGSLYRRGYRDVEIRRQRGASYVAEATGRRGRVLVVVDGRTTEITGLRALDYGGPRHGYEDGGWNGPSPWSGPRW